MPTRKIPNLIKQCKDPQHFPPKMMVGEPGTWEQECPSCGCKTVFIVPTESKPLTIDKT